MRNDYSHFLSDSPSSIEVEILLVNEDSDELRDGELVGNENETREEERKGQLSLFLSASSSYLLQRYIHRLFRPRVQRTKRDKIESLKLTVG